MSLKRITAIILMLLFIVAIIIVVAHAQTNTSLMLQLSWPSSQPVSNAVTTLTNSKGIVVATANGATPHISIPLGVDIYTITVKAANLNGHPLLNYGFNLPMATTIPAGGTTFNVTSYIAKVNFDSAGTHGSITASIAASF